MDMETVRAFFMWCTIMNMGLLTVSIVICAFAGDWVYRTHSKFFPISREAFNVVIYSLLAGYKALLIMFNLVPYIALTIICAN
ncbi:MAG: hypothetical protein GY851_12885 [bacterium]|nr:hypothetical protein [bacterium]